MDNRREFIKKAALLSGAAGLYSVLPASILKAMAIDPKVGSTYMDAEHVVILIQENRSFDHCFGTLKGVRGFNDPRAIDLPNKNKVWMQSNAAGETYAPFRLNIKDTKSTWMNSLPHSWNNQVNARNDGKYDQWLNVKQSGTPAYAKMPLTLGYHTRDDIPFYYAMADAFTVCDQNFCSALTGTTPNRLFLWSGTIREEQNENSKAHVWNDDADFGTLNWKTFPERLEESGISWKCYQNELSIDVGLRGEEDAWLSNFTDNPLEFFSQYHADLHPQHLEQIKRRLPVLVADIVTLKKQLAALPAGDAQAEPLKKQLNEKLLDYKNKETLLEPGQFDRLPQHQQNIHLKAFDTNKKDANYHLLTDLAYNDNGIPRSMKVPRGDVLYQFRDDVKTGHLPAVSWIVAPENFSDHPGAPWYGAWYISEVMDILTKNPEVWKKTIFIVTYDENDGYFDHVPPFVAPHSHKKGTGKVSAGIDTRVEYVTLEQELARKDFPVKYDRECAIGLGYRVPMIIASPWSRGGYVNSEVFDHTSTLQFLEKFLSKKTGKKIEEPNISEWRRTICGDLSSVFRPDGNEKMVNPEPVVKNDFLEEIHKAKFKKIPSDFKLLTAEEIAQLNRDPQSSPYMARQEPGIRPANALPYQLYVEGRLSADKKSFEITFENKDEVFGKRTAGAPFNVYAPGKYMNINHPGVLDEVRTWAYGLKAGDRLNDQWPLAEFEKDIYHLRVYGPNGFYREFMGDVNDPLANISVRYQHNPVRKGTLTGNLEVKIANLYPDDYQVEIIDHSYKINNHHKTAKASLTTSIILNLESSYGWYDFSVKIKGYDHFTKRYAGRIETGKTSFSDPFMGRTIV
ncbi:phosphocholine-specific phospholipase C [Pedobacter hartonius]|uniref:phospholipase C n=1 Tax=Pedobacter hartonius TaxID=425514 RepID=A0A1H4DPV6_9SPHI|nr:phospholipase C, phosphocholine-specific [Pedobacter hartonius]SEA74539.1 phospholipase C [Pedobacter hartonius]